MRNVTILDSQLRHSSARVGVGPFNRRDILRHVGALSLFTTALLWGSAAGATSADGSAVVRTVLGDIAPANLGITLVHEHLSLDFGNFPMDGTFTRDLDLMTDEIILAGLAGVASIVDVSTADLKVDAANLKTLARRTGVNIIVGAGHYVERFYPPSVAIQTVGEIARDLLTEVRRMPAGLLGEIGSSGSREQGWITPAEAKVFRAVGEVHRATGLKILTHTNNGRGGLAQLDLLQSAGVSPENIGVGHLDSVVDMSMHEEIAKRGAWVAFDRVSGDRFTQKDRPDDEARARMVLNLIEKGFAKQILLSSDLARRGRLARSGGKGYGETLMSFVPRLRALGLSNADLNQLLRHNPARFLAFVPRGA